LTIKEWGVRASYTGGDTFTYTLSSDGKFADVDSKQLVSKDSACAKGGSGGIARFSPADYVHQDQHGPTVEQDAAQNPNLYKHIGGYYYRFAHAQALCSGTVSANDQSQANDAVSVLVSNLQAISN
jgi:hypothetical protein